MRFATPNHARESDVCLSDVRTLMQQSDKVSAHQNEHLRIPLERTKMLSF